jgi:hypothetical protein
MRLGSRSSIAIGTNDGSDFITLLLRIANNKAKEYLKEHATSKYFILMYFENLWTAGQNRPKQKATIVAN